MFFNLSYLNTKYAILIIKSKYRIQFSFDLPIITGSSGSFIVQGRLYSLARASCTVQGRLYSLLEKAVLYRATVQPAKASCTVQGRLYSLLEQAVMYRADCIACQRKLYCTGVYCTAARASCTVQGRLYSLLEQAVQYTNRQFMAKRDSTPREQSPCREICVIQVLPPLIIC